MITVTKVCSKCKAEKLTAAFSFCKRNTGGLKCMCKQCASEADKIYRQINNNQKIKPHSTKSKKDLIREASRQYYLKNKEKIMARNKIYIRFKRKTDPKFKIGDNTSRAINYALKGNKAGRRWESLVGYSSDDLHNHLESLFAEGMSWENYGYGENKWHIDHIRPICSFNYLTAEDPQFKECWALKNLRPFWQIDNLKKASEDRKQSINKICQF